MILKKIYLVHIILMEQQEHTINQVRQHTGRDKGEDKNEILLFGM